ncbi:MAG: hypothetical protein IKM15_07490 [Peptococcaceae bacterium]|nr:hypothetical protein [Peptococcaceae bacterium]
MARRTQNLDKAVEMALFTLATGAKTTEIKTVYKNGEEVETVETVKQLAPDYKALQMWLCAKMPEIWGDLANREDGRVDELLEKITELCESQEKVQ